MTEPGLESLSDVIGALRSAAPSDAAIAQARAGLMKALAADVGGEAPERSAPTEPAAAPWASIAAVGTTVLAVLLALGLPRSTAAPATSRAPRATLPRASQPGPVEADGVVGSPTFAGPAEAVPSLAGPTEVAAPPLRTRLARLAHPPPRTLERPVAASTAAGATSPIASATSAAAPSVAASSATASVGGARARIDAARREMGERRWADAAARLQAVRDGRVDATPLELQEAELRLARCLLELGLVHASLEALAQIAESGPAHAFFPQALPALGRLAGRVPEPARLIDAVGHYSDEAIRTSDPEERAALGYLGGRARFASGELDSALGLLSLVPDAHLFGLEARLVEGVTHVRLRRAGPAERSLRRAIAAVDEGRARHADPSRMRHLAYLDLGRLRYSRARSHPSRDAGERELDRALTAWRHIPLEAPLGEVAFFEETWALFGLGHPERALGHVHTLRSPMLGTLASLEALAIRAIIQLEHCQWSATEAAVAEARAALGPLREGLEAVRRRVPTEALAYALLVGVRERRVPLPRAARRRIQHALDDPAVGRQVMTVSAIASEQARLQQAPLSEIDPALRTAVSTVLRDAHVAAVQRAGARTQRELDGMIGSFDGLESRLDTVEIEMTTARRQELTRPNTAPMGSPEGGPIWAIQGGARWPFDGEWWTDELPFFRQEITNRCGR